MSGSPKDRMIRKSWIYMILIQTALLPAGLLYQQLYFYDLFQMITLPAVLLGWIYGISVIVDPELAVPAQTTWVNITLFGCFGLAVLSFIRVFVSDNDGMTFILVLTPTYLSSLYFALSWNFRSAAWAWILAIACYYATDFIVPGRTDVGETVLWCFYGTVTPFSVSFLPRYDLFRKIRSSPHPAVFLSIIRSVATYMIFLRLLRDPFRFFPRMADGLRRAVDWIDRAKVGTRD